MAKTIFELWVEHRDEYLDDLSPEEVEEHRITFYTGAYSMQEACWSLSHLSAEEIDIGITELEDEVELFFEQLNHTLN